MDKYFLGPKAIEESKSFLEATIRKASAKSETSQCYNLFRLEIYYEYLDSIRMIPIYFCVQNKGHANRFFAAEIHFSENKIIHLESRYPRKLIDKVSETIPSIFCCRYLC